MEPRSRRPAAGSSAGPTGAVGGRRAATALRLSLPATLLLACGGPERNLALAARRTTTRAEALSLPALTSSAGLPSEEGPARLVLEGEQLHFDDTRSWQSLDEERLRSVTAALDGATRPAWSEAVLDPIPAGALRWTAGPPRLPLLAEAVSRHRDRLRTFGPGDSPWDGRLDLHLPAGATVGTAAALLFATGQVEVSQWRAAVSTPEGRRFVEIDAPRFKSALQDDRGPCSPATVARTPNGLLLTPADSSEGVTVPVGGDGIGPRDLAAVLEALRATGLPRCAELVVAAPETERWRELLVLAAWARGEGMGSVMVAVAMP